MVRNRVWFCAVLAASSLLGAVTFQSCRAPDGGRDSSPGDATPRRNPQAEPNTSAQPSGSGLKLGPASLPEAGVPDGRSDVVSEEEYKAFLTKYGIESPITHESAFKVLRQVLDADDATLRRVLVILMWAPKGPGKAPKGRQEPKWDLPDSFGERILKLARPWYKHAWTGSDMEHEEWYYASMLVTVLARMQYKPALLEFMEPGAVVNPLGPVSQWWPAWGAAAFEPLLERAREGGKPGREALGRLVEISDPEAIPDFRRLLESTDPAERNVALAALRAMRAEMDVSRFRDAVKNPKAQYGERMEAAQAIADMGGADDLKFMLEHAQAVLTRPDKLPRDESVIAEEAVGLMLRRQDPATIAWVMEYVRGRENDSEARRACRSHVMRGLSSYRVKVAEPLLIAILEDESEHLDIRQAAAMSLSNMVREKEFEYYKRYVELRERASAQRKMKEESK